MNTFIVADWHLGEDRFEIMQRPFKDVMSHIHKLIFEHNQLVDENDTVIVNGDVCYQKAPEYLKYVKWFNGKKILVRGNHDRVFTDEQLEPYFDRIIPEGDGMYLTVLGNDNDEKGDYQIPCWITHYPTCGKKDYFNITGHVHGAWKFQLNMLNVGVDCHGYAPLNVNKIPFFKNAITKFYDEDVWVAYNDINMSYRDTRGKKSSYFNPNKG